MAITKKAKDAIRIKAQQIMFEKAQDAKKNIENKYLDLVKSFYFEEVFENNPAYDPVYYLRHYNYNTSIGHVKNSGLGRTYQPYYKKSNSGWNITYTAGIRINDERMFNNYAGTLPQETIHGYIINSYLGGWHGLPGEIYGGIRGNLSPYAEMLEYREKLIKRLSTNWR